MKEFDTDKYHRHSLRLAGYDYSAAGAYFVTICANNKQNLFGDIIDDDMILNAAGRIVNEEWMACGHLNEQIIIDAYVVMPNHFHGIVVFTNDIPVGEINVGAIHEMPLPPHKSPINKSSPSITRQQRRLMALPKLIGRFKMRSAKRINELNGTPGTPIWQRNYYERIIRDEDELNRIREYIAFNPTRWEEDEEFWYGKT